MARDAFKHRSGSEGGRRCWRAGAAEEARPTQTEGGYRSLASRRHGQVSAAGVRRLNT